MKKYTTQDNIEFYQDLLKDNKEDYQLGIKQFDNYTSILKGKFPNEKTKILLQKTIKFLLNVKYNKSCYIMEIKKLENQKGGI